MNLQLSEQQRLLQDMFGKMFRQESSPARVRAAEATGFDAALWRQLVDSAAPLMRVPDHAGGGGVNLLDAAVVAEEAGRHLVSVPLIETIVAARLLALAGGGAAADWLARIADGSALVTLALRENDGRTQLVPGAGAADAVLWLDGERLLLHTGFTREEGRPAVLGALPHARLDPTEGSAVTLAEGTEIRAAWLAAMEEWKLLSAAMLTGAAQEALRLAAAYSRERAAFGKPIGSFQGVAHPLADSATDNDGARLLVWRAIAALTGRGACVDAGAEVSMAWWFAAQAAGRAVTRAIRVFGGYGMSLEYDIQLYFRRIRGWSLLAGDPADELQLAGDRLWAGASTALPEPGDVEMDFTWGENAEKLVEEARAFFAAHREEIPRDFAYHSEDAHLPAFFRKLAQARLLYPEWPERYLGRGSDGIENAALQEVFNDADFPILVPVVTDMVGKMLLEFGTPEAREEILPRLADGSAYCSLGYSEPSGGSDVFAAKTRAVRDGDDWLIDGQKMFTTQGHLADYALMLVRTNPEVAKHAGLTLFVVPLRQPGYESHEVKTLGAERTNITYYTDMRVPDRYRLGEVDGGTLVMGAALKLEQGVGLYNVGPMRRLLKRALRWACTAQGRDRAAIERPQVRARLARLACSIEVADALTRRAIWACENGCSEKWYGSMSKLFGSEAWLAHAGELMELAAPDTLECAPSDTGWIEIEYRRAVPSTIYGGTSEIHRSIISESALGMPRSRV